MTSSGDIYVEFQRIGALLKCTVIDAATGEEAFAVGPANASRADLQKLALGKLMRRRHGQT